jgi:hypothetical protein
MIRRLSTQLLTTRRETPADASAASHALLVRAGMLQQAGAGLFVLAPLLLRVVRRIEAIIREELVATGCHELRFTQLQPPEPWRASDRWEELTATDPIMLRTRDRAGAELAYLLSVTAVQYLVEESGARGMEVFLGRWRETGDFEAAFRRTFGYTTGGFETRWLEHVKRRYSWLVVLSQTAIFWLMVGVALILLFRIRRQRDLERMARLRAGEIPDDPAYWEPPPMPPVGGFRSDVERARKPGPPRVDRPPRPG